MCKKWYNENGDIMKKIVSLLFILFLVGCSKKDYITCNIEINNNTDNYTMTGIYKIYYKSNYVINIEKKENYISSDESMIDYFYESKNLEYYNLDDLYNGYTYKIDKDESSIDINVTIDMNSVDINEMVKDQKIDKDYVISNKLTTSGIVKIYESKGAICDI